MAYCRIKYKDYGIDLGERAVRYHLKLTDERGLISLVGRDGRVLTKQGEEELNTAMVKDKVGLAISKKYKINMRKAAYVVAVERVVEAMKLRSWV